MLPVIALIGRPNVGKSTLFNRLTRSRDALVADTPGLTRDRQYGEFSIDSRRLILVDTGGVCDLHAAIDTEVERQSLAALRECDLALLLVDARDGLLAGDREALRLLRQSGKAFVLVLNKVDGLDEAAAVAEFRELGVGELLCISAAHGRGLRQLQENMLLHLSEAPQTAPGDEQTDEPGRVRVAVVGRPNVGKSTLVNRILGEERVVVFDQPGTTRDSIHIDFDRGEQRYTLVDTAGVRRGRSVHESIEKFSVLKTMQAIAEANVVLLVIDAREGLVEQDMHLLGHVIDSGRALVIVCNKWDGLSAEQRDAVRNELDRRLQFADFAESHFISALHGSNVGHLYAAIDRAWVSACQTLSASRLTAVLERAVAAHSPPLVHGRRIKLRYAHIGGRNPPIVVIHGNQTGSVPDHYRRYLEKTFRAELALVGSPLRVEFVTGTNPYAGRRNTLTPRQERKRKRLLKHVKK